MSSAVAFFSSLRCESNGRANMEANELADQRKKILLYTILEGLQLMSIGNPLNQRKGDEETGIRIFL